MNNYDAIVVGGGLAGLTSAAYLTKYGCKTLLCEKGRTTGGLVRTFRHNGYAFDAGIRAFENSGILYPMLKSLGLELETRSNPVSIGIGSEWVRMTSRDSLGDYAALLGRIFEGRAADIRLIMDEIKKVITYMDVLYGIDNPLFLDSYDKEYLLKTLLPWLLKYQVNIRKAARLKEPVVQFLNQLTKSRALVDMIAQHFFRDTPTFFALSYFGLYLDYSYPLGGTGMLAEKMTDYALSKGCELKTETPVVRVNPQNKELRTGDGQTYRYDKLVWAADQKAFYSMTNGASGADAGACRALSEKSSGGDSVFSVFIGAALDTGYFSDVCGAHAFYTPSATGLSALPDWQSALKDGNQALESWVERYLELTTYEISCPALRDRSLAPEGKTGLIVSTLMDYGLVRHFQKAGRYEQFKTLCTEKILEVLGSSIFPELQPSIEFAFSSTPLTIERLTGNSGGAITGWAFTNHPVPAESRFPKVARSIKTPYRDIYQCGQWSFSPSGLPISILTGKLAADAVRKDLKKVV